MHSTPPLQYEHPRPLDHIETTVRFKESRQLSTPLPQPLSHKYSCKELHTGRAQYVESKVDDPGPNEGTWRK